MFIKSSALGTRPYFATVVDARLGVLGVAMNLLPDSPAGVGDPSGIGGPIF